MSWAFRIVSTVNINSEIARAESVYLVFKSCPSGLWNSEGCLRSPVGKLKSRWAGCGWTSVALLHLPLFYHICCLLAFMCYLLAFLCKGYYLRGEKFWKYLKPLVHLVQIFKEITLLTTEITHESRKCKTFALTVLSMCHSDILKDSEGELYI